MISVKKNKKINNLYVWSLNYRDVILIPSPLIFLSQMFEKKSIVDCDVHIFSTTYMNRISISQRGIHYSFGMLLVCYPLWKNNFVNKFVWLLYKEIVY